MIHDLYLIERPEWTPADSVRIFAGQLHGIAPSVDCWLTSSQFVKQQVQRYLADRSITEKPIAVLPMGWDSFEALRDAGQPHTAEAAMVKWMGPKTAFDAIHQCLLTFGHYGWSMDLPHQQRLRDVMGLEIGDGTAQIMKLIVARERVGRAAVQYAKESKK